MDQGLYFRTGLEEMDLAVKTFKQVSTITKMSKDNNNDKKIKRKYKSIFMTSETICSMCQS
jgi:hypothetical protein